MNVDEVYSTSIDKWSKNRGIGIISYDRSLDLFTPIKYVLNKFFSYDPNRTVMIVVPNKSRIDEWTTILTKGFDHIDKVGSDELKFVTADNVIINNIRDKVTLVIFDQIDRFVSGKKLDIVKGEFIKYKYILGVTNSPDPYNDTFELYDVCPIIDRVTKVDVVTHNLLDSTIDFNIPIKMGEDDTHKFNEYTEFIKETIDMFDGNFELIMQCYHGNPRQGISADYYRTEFAKSKGWTNELDTSSGYFANLDRYFNPNAIYERAKIFMDIIRKRKFLMSDNAAKIDAIIRIVERFKDKKILIINKRSSFARDVAAAINARIKGENLKSDKPQPTLFKPTDKIDGYTVDSNVMCVEYHPDVESRPLVDIETNDYIRYKSGAKKGEVRKFGSTNLNKIANDRFNNGYHSVLSSSNAMPSEADLTIDFIIVTSPECDTLNKFQYRVHRLDFVENMKVINLYLDNTKEVDKLKEKQALTNTKVVQTTIEDVIL